jgi:hypothetical protein
VSLGVRHHSQRFPQSNGHGNIFGAFGKIEKEVVVEIVNKRKERRSCFCYLFWRRIFFWYFSAFCVRGALGDAQTEVSE